MNYKLVATKVAESMENRDTSRLNKVAHALASFPVKTHVPGELFRGTSSSFDIVYNWVMSLAEARLSEPEKMRLLRQFITELQGDPGILAESEALDLEPLPPEVPQGFAADYLEARAVLPHSPKASAALSRRCLQKLLRTTAGVKAETLDSEIQQVLNSKQLPADLAEAIDAVRVLGNFAAHPIKSQVTGEIIDIEPGEAEWSISVLEELFDFYFVRPKVLLRKRESLDAKLKAAGKPPLKSHKKELPKAH